MPKFLKYVFLALTGFSILVIIAFSGVYVYYLNEISKPIFIQDTSITIEKGASIEQIGNLLYEKGLLSRPELLKVYMLLNPEKSIQAGIYDFSDDNRKSLVELVDFFKEGSFDISLTFIEGWRIEEYRDYISKKMSPEFAKEFMASKFIKEGYMFPDTYTVAKDYDPEDLASYMRNNFKKKVTRDLIDTAEFKNLSLEEVVIISSILEREMNIRKDRPIVAGILIKRWKNGWPLQADATVQYAKGNSRNWWPNVGKVDLGSVDSPYNTYLHKGLPPAPISNPGIDAIEAVVNYQTSPYWFYLTGKDGVTRYGETIEEHNKNVRNYL